MSSQSANPSPVRSGEDVDAIMHALTDLQSGLGNLKKIREETAQLEAQVADRRVEIDNWDRKLRARNDELAQQNTALEQRAKELAAHEHDLAQRQQAAEAEAKGLEAQRQELAAKGSKLELHRREVETRDNDLKSRVSALEEKARKLAADRSSIDQRAEAVSARQRELSDMAGALDTQRKELDARKESLERQRQELQNRANKLDAQRKDLEDKTVRLEALRTELDAAKADSDRRQQDLAARTAEVERAKTELDAARPVLEAQRIEVAKEREQALALRKHAETIRRESSDQAEVRLRDLASREAELVAREVTCKQAETEAAEVVAQATRKRDEAVASAQRAMERVSVLEREIDGMRSGSTTASETANAALERARHEAQAAQERAEKTIAQSSELEEAAARVREESRQQIEELAARVNEATGIRASLEGRVASLENELRQAVESLEARTAELAAVQQLDPEDLAKRDLAIEALTKQLEEARQWAQMLESELETAKASAADAVAAVQSRPAPAPTAQQPERRSRSSAGKSETWVDRRRRRLARYKSLLQGQARKVMNAKEALDKRRIECDQILAQRGKLAQAVEMVRARERKVESRRAAGGALAAVFCAVGTLAVLSILSWTATNQIVPATYVATAVIEADVRGRPPAEGEVAGWQQYHEDLITGPRIAEIAAERFAKRGITTLGSPSELAARLKTDLDVASDAPGRMKVELRGKGSDRTARELDTLITAVASVANAERTSRTDGLPTIIAQAAQVAKEPIEDPRPAYALGVAGGGLVASMLFGYMVWTRLSRGKHRYDEEQKVGEALTDLAWAEAPVAKHR